MPETRPTRPFARRLLALGDSYTIGEGVPPRDRWPAQLARRLDSPERPIATIEFLAQTGWTAAELAAAIAKVPPQGPYDLVSLMVGVNDQYRGGAVAAYADVLRELCGHSVALAGESPGRVLVVSIPDWGATPFAAERDRARIAREIDAFNAAARNEAKRARARWVDVTALSRRSEETALVVADQLHPSAAMYKRWVDAMIGTAQAAWSHARDNGASATGQV